MVLGQPAGPWSPWAAGALAEMDAGGPLAAGDGGHLDVVVELVEKRLELLVGEGPIVEPTEVPDAAAVPPLDPLHVPVGAVELAPPERLLATAWGHGHPATMDRTGVRRQPLPSAPMDDSDLDPELGAALADILEADD